MQWMSACGFWGHFEETKLDPKTSENKGEHQKSLVILIEYLVRSHIHGGGQANLLSGSPFGGVPGE